MPNPLRDKLKKEIEELSSRFKKQSKTGVNTDSLAKSKNRTEDLSTVNTSEKSTINRSEINLGNRNVIGKSDIDRSDIKLENKGIVDGHEGKDRTKTNEGVRGVDGHKPQKIKGLNNVLDGEVVPDKEEMESNNVYKGSKAFVRKTDSLTNVYIKK